MKRVAWIWAPWPRKMYAGWAGGRDGEDMKPFPSYSSILLILILVAVAAAGGYSQKDVCPFLLGQGRDEMSGERVSLAQDN